MKKLVDNILINLTSEEINQRQIDENNFIASRISKQAKEEQQESKKQSGIAKLKALGLDEEEVKAILGV